MLKIIFNQVVRRLFPNRSMQSLTQSEILKAQNQAIQIMNRTKGKTGEVIDLTGRRIDPNKPIIGGKNVAETEAQVKARLLKTQQETLERLRNKKKTVEDFRDEGDWDPSGMASGGIARVGYAAGKIVKGGKWFLKSLLDTRQKIKTMNMSPGQLKYYLNQIDDQIKNIEAGGKIPDEVIQTIRKDPKFRSVHQTRSTDPDMFEMEQVILDYGKKHAEGGIAGELHLNRPGYSSGLLVKLAKLLKGKKKNVWRGFETDYKNILRGDMYPGEFSGRFFTPDKDLAKWYAMRQGTLTGKVKKLKLTEKEIKAAQEFAKKNLRIQYADDLVVSDELAKKARVDLPATVLAKIEAAMRKAKGIGPFLHKTHKGKDKINPKIPFVKKAEGGLAEILGV